MSAEQSQRTAPDRAVMTPVSDRVVEGATRIRALHEVIRAVYSDPAADWTPIEQAQLIEVALIEMGRHGSRPDEDGRVVFYVDPETGEPVSRIPAASRLLQDRAAAITAARQVSMTQAAIAAALGISQSAVSQALDNARRTSV